MEKQKFPEVRFKGFTDVWKQFRLGELCSEFRSGEFIKAEKIASSGNYPVYGGNGLRGYTDTYNHDGDFALIGRQGALCGNMQFSYGKAFFTEHAVAVKANTSNDTSFLYHLFGTMNLGQYSGQSAQPGLAVGNLIEIETLVPDKTEQTTIGNFFQNLDQSIVLHEKKFTQTQNLKKAMLEKMFPKAGSKQPEIRLKGFSGEWQEKQLKDISFKVLEKNGENLYSETFTNSAQFGVISQRDFFDKDISNSSNIGGYYVVKENDFIYNPRISNFAPVGPIKRNKLGRIGVVSPLYFVFRVQDVDYQFLETYFETSIWHKFMLLNGDTGARSDRLAIKDTIFVEMPIHCPSAEEQKQVGQFFKQLDETLALQQQQLQTLKNLKQAFLEKMFV